MRHPPFEIFFQARPPPTRLPQSFSVLNSSLRCLKPIKYRPNHARIAFKVHARARLLEQMLCARWRRGGHAACRRHLRITDLPMLSYFNVRKFCRLVAESDKRAYMQNASYTGVYCSTSSFSRERRTGSSLMSQDIPVAPAAAAGDWPVSQGLVSS